MSKIAFPIMLKSIILACTYLIHQLNPIVDYIYLNIPPIFRYLFIYLFLGKGIPLWIHYAVLGSLNKASITFPQVYHSF